MITAPSKSVVTLALLFAQIPWCSGCEPPPVSNDQIARINSSVAELMETAKVHSLEATNSVDKAFQDITTYLRTNNFSDPEITYLEEQRGVLRGKSAKLRGDLNKIRAQIESMFSLLRRRAGENQIPYYRDDMFARIAAEEGRLNFMLRNALEVNDKVDASIQFYDDLLGYIQVRKGLDEGGRLEEEQIRLWMQEAARLNQEVQDAIGRALAVIQRLRQE